MNGGFKSESSFDTLCYVTTIYKRRMNDGLEYGSSVEMENRRLRKQDYEKLDVENPEEEDTYNEESMNYKSVIQVKFFISKYLV
jgi:hypothetical protein